MDETLGDSPDKDKLIPMFLEVYKGVGQLQRDYEVYKGKTVHLHSPTILKQAVELYSK